MKGFIVIVAALALVAPAFSAILNRCSLARKLDSMGVPRSEMPQWTCIAKHESSYRTDAVGPPNTNGSQDYGIFQINSLYWCQPDNGKFSYNGCSLRCNSLLSDDISNSVKCARTVKSEQGWSAWSVWKFCNGKLPSIDDCF